MKQLIILHWKGRLAKLIFSGTFYFPGRKCDFLPFVCGLDNNSKQEVVQFLEGELKKETANLSYGPNNLPANYITVEGESSGQLEGCIMIALSAQTDQFK